MNYLGRFKQTAKSPQRNAVSMLAHVRCSNVARSGLNDKLRSDRPLLSDILAHVLLFSRQIYYSVLLQYVEYAYTNDVWCTGMHAIGGPRYSYALDVSYRIRHPERR